ncbi:30845_t:CDS:1, partial [Racocetra persica]
MLLLENHILLKRIIELDARVRQSLLKIYRQIARTSSEFETMKFDNIDYAAWCHTIAMLIETIVNILDSTIWRSVSFLMQMHIYGSQISSNVSPRVFYVLSQRELQVIR